jgi:hypothetical protein
MAGFIPRADHFQVVSVLVTRSNARAHLPITPMSASVAPV